MAEVYTWGDVTLADTSAGDIIDQERINGERAVQMAELLRAVSAQPLNRGQSRVTLSFRVTRLHATVDDARGFLYDHALALAAEAATTITFTRTVGEVDQVQTLNDALVRMEEGSRSGLTTYHLYTIIGGYFTPPETP